MATLKLNNICKKYIYEDSLNLITFNDLIYSKHNPAVNVIPRENYNKNFRIQDINLKVPHGETLVILGPSGCGKSTLLKIIAGLIPVDSGKVYYNEMLMNNIESNKRNIGYVFQSYALYPHFSAKKNILAFFKFRKKTRELKKAELECYQKTSELMGVDINYLLDRKPAKLSGGEQQRVAIARCITRRPDLFLMDEPFSNLDQNLREKYRINLKKLLKTFQVTTIYVTHDQQEALILADKIAIMKEGKIEQTGTSKEIYNSPKNTFIADFLNIDPLTPAINFMEGKNISKDFNDKIIGVRPENIEIHNPEQGYKYILDVQVLSTRKVSINNIMLLNVKFKDNEIIFKSKTRKIFNKNDIIQIGIKEYLLFSRTKLFLKNVS